MADRELYAEQAQYHGLQAVDTRRYLVTHSTGTDRPGYSTSNTGFIILYFINDYEYSTMLETTRTYVARITNHSQVRTGLDQCGFSASKLWNVGRYYIQEQWDKDGEIPDEAELKSELKNHERYSDLHSQSSQRVLEELAEAFNGWYNSDDGNNPPGYRKRGDRHPRSTVTWKQKG